MIEVYDNYDEGGDWVVVKVNGKCIFSSHSFNHINMVETLKEAGIPVVYARVSDEEIEKI